VNDSDDELPDDGLERPSRSARKRVAEGLQKLGVRLVELRESELETLELPEALLQAVREARRLTSRPAQARQRQYIGKLMREVDPAPIEKLLAARTGNPLHRAKMPR
jgi:ribosome-associated protein